MEFLQRHPITTALAAIALLLVVAIGFETGWGTRLQPPTPGTGPVKAAAVDAKLLPPIVATSPEQAYPETGARPLFTPTRRPAPQAAAAANMVKGQFVLHGVTIVGDLRIALLKEKSSGRTVRAEKGRDINGMTVAEIEADRVTLKLGDDAETLPLTVQRAAGSPPAAAAATPAGPFASPPLAGQTVPGMTGRQTGIQGGPMPAQPGTPGQFPASPGTPAPIPGQTPATGATAVPGSRSDPSSSTAPASAAGALTPEELLARRRARRTQPGAQ